ncbi:MAG: hypothetical protein AAF196_18360 [Planctomycetota bacterium]
MAPDGMNGIHRTDAASGCSPRAGASVTRFVLLGFLCLAAAPLAAQVPNPNDPFNPFSRTTPRAIDGVDGGVQGRLQSAIFPDRIDFDGVSLPPGFQGIERDLPIFQDFPVIVPPGFGSYPGGRLPSPFGESEELIPSAPGVSLPKSDNSWPSWFEDGGDGEFPIDVALLVQRHDAVWLYATPETRGPTRLSSFERFRKIEAGARYEVRGRGSAAISFRGGDRVESQGPAAVQLTSLADEELFLESDTFQRLTVRSTFRRVLMRLSTAGVLEVEGSAVSIVRDGRLATVHNIGGLPVRFVDEGRPVTIRPGRQITILPGRRSDDPVGSEFKIFGPATRTDNGRVVSLTTGGETAIEWSGARIVVQGVASVRLDPLAGDSFPANDKRD